MKPIAVGGILAALLVGFFFIGAYTDGDELDSGPAETLGESIDEGLNDAQRAVEDAAD